jgi:aryl-phospho-beta-D-glucosidase BglC (GH1 family)
VPSGVLTLGTDPTGPNLFPGCMYFNDARSVFRVYDGTEWSDFQVPAVNSQLGIGKATSPYTEIGAGEISQAVQATVDSFNLWCSNHSVSGCFTEFGGSYDDPRWQPVVARFLEAVDTYGMPVWLWGAAESWLTTKANIFYASDNVMKGAGGGPLAVPLHTAVPLEVSAKVNPTVPRGIAIKDGYLGGSAASQVEGGTNAGFSNTRDNVANYLATGLDATNERSYGRPDSYKFLASRGIKHVRIPFRWEIIQHTLGGALDTTEMGYLDASLQAALDAGVQVILDMHNYGGFSLDDGTQGVRHYIGTTQVTIAHYQDVWTRIAQRYVSSPLRAAIYAYEIMNEPQNMPDLTQAAANRWIDASNQCVQAIRAVDATMLCIVPSFDFSVPSFWQYHTTDWLYQTGSSGAKQTNVLYNAHLYPDANNSGAFVSPQTVNGVSYKKNFDAARAQNSGSFNSAVGRDKRILGGHIINAGISYRGTCIYPAVPNIPAAPATVPAAATLLYTVPAGKVAVISNIQFMAGGTGGSSKLYVRPSGQTGVNDAWCRWVPNITASTGSSLGAPTFMDSGEMLVWSPSVTGCYISYTIYELPKVDLGVTLVVPHILNSVSGDNTLYTCPGGKLARVLASGGSSVAFHGSAACNLNAATVTIQPKFKPNGYAATAAAPSFTVVTNGTPATPLGVIDWMLNPGDAIVLNTSVTGFNVWALIEELG